MIEAFAKIEYWHWLSLAVILGILDVTVGANFFLVWCGISAAIVGATLWLIPKLGWEWQFLIFGVGVFCSFFVWRKFALHSKDKSKNSRLNQRAAQYIGRTFTLEQPIENGRGRVRVDDSYWRIEGEDMPAGVKIKVVDVDGVVLKVKSQN